jgi:hypothetical protein
MTIKKIILTFNPGSFEDGYQGILTSPDINLDRQFRLPSNLEIAEKFTSWSTTYDEMVENSRIFTSLQKDLSSQHYIDSCNKKSKELVNALNSWLKAEDFRETERAILNNFSKLDENLLILKTDDTKLWQLPWHQWNLILPDWRKTEIVLCPPNFTPIYDDTQKSPNSEKLKVLSILGNSQEGCSQIDLEPDREILTALQAKFIQEPSWKELHEELNNQWDIVCFSGHSGRENERCFIKINQNTLISMIDLSQPLKKAAAQIAIFNSCDNLEIAFNLQNVGVIIPYLLLMSKQVPDFIAQEFLKFFLQEYRAGKSLYLSVREARSKLEMYQDRYPCSTWLPKIVQPDISKTAPDWDALITVQPNPSGTAPKWIDLVTVSSITKVLIPICVIVLTLIRTLTGTNPNLQNNNSLFKGKAFFWLENKKTNTALAVIKDSTGKDKLTLQPIDDSKPRINQLFTWVDDKSDSRRVISYGGLILTQEDIIDRDKVSVVLFPQSSGDRQLFRFKQKDENWWLTISSFKINGQQGHGNLSIDNSSSSSKSIFVRKIESEPEMEIDEDLWKVHWTKEENVSK